MLGWEFPPHISGRLGTACQGLVRGLVARGVDVTFVVPRAFGDEDGGGARIVGLQRGPARRARGVCRTVVPRARHPRGPDAGVDPVRDSGPRRESAADAGFRDAAPRLPHPDPLPLPAAPSLLHDRRPTAPSPLSLRGDLRGAPARPAPGHGRSRAGAGSRARRHARAHRRRRAPVSRGHGAAPHGGGEAPPSRSPAATGPTCSPRSRATPRRRAPRPPPDFDVVHAHDWMTFPAGAAAAARRGSRSSCTCTPRSTTAAGRTSTRESRDIEQFGLDAADRVVTREPLHGAASCARRYRVDPRRSGWSTTRSPRREQPAAPGTAGTHDRRADRAVPRPRHVPEGARLLPGGAARAGGRRPARRASS